VRDGVDDHGVDVEPEAEREHSATVAPPQGVNRIESQARYASGEEGEVVADGSR
jgi:hypothetical protein